jgi:hypothetical protein
MRPAPERNRGFYRDVPVAENDKGRTKMLGTILLIILILILVGSLPTWGYSGGWGYGPSGGAGLLVLLVVLLLVFRVI